MIKRGIWILTVVVSSALSGCAFLKEATAYHSAEASANGENYRVSVSGFGSQDKIAGKTYFLASALKNTPEGDLQFKEYAQYLERALDRQGYQRVQDTAKADLIIFFAYGIGDPQTTQYSYNVPMWGQTGVSGATTFGTATSYGGHTSYTGTTFFTPSFGVTGYIPVTGSETSYFRYARVDCYDYAAFKKEKKEYQLWRTDINSTGSNSDLRRVMPVMVAAARPLFGINTGEAVGVDINSSDDVVSEIKGLPIGVQKNGAP